MRRSTNTRRADPAERLAAAHAQLVTAVQELTNGEEWRRMRHRLNLAIEAGELAPDLDVDEALAFLIAPLVYRHVFADQTVTDDAIHRTVAGFLTLHRRP